MLGDHALVTPPLVITSEQVAELVGRIDCALTRVEMDLDLSPAYDLTQDAERFVSRRKSRMAADLEQRLTQLVRPPSEFSPPRKCVLSSPFCPMAASADTTTRLRCFSSRPGRFHTPPHTCSMAVSKNGARNGSPGALR